MKAVILEIRNGKAAVLGEDGTISKVRTDRLVGDTIELPETAHIASGRLMKMAASAAAVLLLVLTGSYYMVYASPYAYVSMDVNPSIEYTINRRQEVIDIRALNTDAQAIVQGVEERIGKRCTLSEAMGTAAVVMQDADYLGAEEEDYILVNISSDHMRETEFLETEVEQLMSDLQMHSDSTISYLLSTSTKREHRDAAKQGMSVGRYKSFEEHAGDESVEIYKEKPVRELLSEAEAEVITPSRAPSSNRNSNQNGETSGNTLEVQENTDDDKSGTQEKETGLKRDVGRQTENRQNQNKDTDTGKKTSSGNNTQKDKSGEAATSENGQSENGKNGQTKGDTTPQNERTEERTSPQNEQAGGDTTSKNEQTGEDTAPNNGQTGGDTAPQNRQTGGDAAPQNRQTEGDTTPNNGQTGGNKDSQNEQTNRNTTPQNGQGGNSVPPQNGGNTSP